MDENKTALVAHNLWLMAEEEPEKLRQLAAMIYMDIEPEELKKELWELCAIALAKR